MKSLGSLLLLFVALNATGQSSEVAQLTTLLNTFLDSVNSAEMHDRFWADDLIYTSSTGKRFGKKEIMEGFETPASEGPTTAYWAEDKQVKVYGETAIVAFRLMAKDPNGSVVARLNSGTFVKRDGSWQVVCWQSTNSPE